MKQNQALKLRTAISAILSFSDALRYQVAIQQRWAGHDEDDWEVHVFVVDEKKSGLINCALLCNAIEQISTDFLTTESHYNMATKDVPNNKPSFKIW